MTPKLWATLHLYIGITIIIIIIIITTTTTTTITACKAQVGLYYEYKQVIAQYKSRKLLQPISSNIYKDMKMKFGDRSRWQERLS